jgi:hypothetical protein
MSGAKVGIFLELGKWGRVLIDVRQCDVRLCDNAMCDNASADNVEIP